MPSFNFRVVLAGMAAVAAATPVRAQLEDDAIVDILRECRKIADDEARTACFDNIPIGERSASVTPQTSPAPTAPATPRQSFGGHQLPPPEVSGRAAAEPSEITAIVATASERTPGVYLLTLEDGTQWQFVDSVPASYNPPRDGSRVEIESAALGSFLLRYEGQRPVRARRIR